jgi:hypothetical protein
MSNIAGTPGRKAARSSSGFTRPGAVRYRATLTYFYRTPELQMGEYSRLFTDKEEAQAWAASYKGENVMVHVNPRDTTKSALRKEEL